jgi:hypothetical protein
MRALVAIALLAGTAHAEPLPPGALELIGGAIGGTGADAKRVGFGWQFGASAAWQPMDTSKRWSIAVRWSVLFAGLYDSMASLDQSSSAGLRTVMMDLTGGVRFRPWATPSRYLTLRLGAGILRSNDPISGGSRDYLGPVSSVGIDQYAGTLLLGVDVRYALMPAPFIASGPEQVAIVLRVGVAGP